MTSLNIIYSHADESYSFKHRLGFTVTQSTQRKLDAINVHMGRWQDPQPQDSILILEPYIISARDYDAQFLAQFKNVFGWCRSLLGQLPNFTPVLHPSFAAKHLPHTPPWNQRRNEIAIINSNKSSSHRSELYSYRIALADFLHRAYCQNKSPYAVKWYGEIAIDRPYYIGKVETKDEILRAVKFNLCTENCYHELFSHDYLTEKLPDSFKSGSVPLYLGAHNIDRYFKSNLYIDLRNQTHEQILSRLLSYTEEDYQRQREPLTRAYNFLARKMSFPYLYEQIRMKAL
jgi:hypothetical protein